MCLKTKPLFLRKETIWLLKKTFFSALCSSLNNFHRQRDNSPEPGRNSNSRYWISLPAVLVDLYLGFSTTVEWVTFTPHADRKLLFSCSSGADRKCIRHLLQETAMSDVLLHGITWPLINILLFWDELCAECSYSISVRPFLCENASWTARRKW